MLSSGIQTDSFCAEHYTVLSDSADITPSASAHKIPKMRRLRCESDSSSCGDVLCVQCRKADKMVQKDHNIADIEPLLTPDLPCPPYPVDRHHLYCIKTTAASVVPRLHHALQECDVDFQFQSSGCKYKCYKYIQFDELEFVIRIYHSRDGLLVECQRRSGCLLLWDYLYSMFYKKMMPYIDHSALPCSQSPMGQKKILQKSGFLGSLTKSFFAQKNYVTVRTTSRFKVVEDMVTSSCRDIQREGCKALASITREKGAAIIFSTRKSIMSSLMHCALSVLDLEMACSALASLYNILTAAVDINSSNDHAMLYMIQVVATFTKYVKRTESSLQARQFFRECRKLLNALGSVIDKRVSA